MSYDPEQMPMLPATALIYVFESPPGKVPDRVQEARTAVRWHVDQLTAIGNDPAGPDTAGGLELCRVALAVLDAAMDKGPGYAAAMWLQQAGAWIIEMVDDYMEGTSNATD